MEQPFFAVKYRILIQILSESPIVISITRFFGILVSQIRNMVFHAPDFTQVLVTKKAAESQTRYGSTAFLCTSHCVYFDISAKEHCPLLSLDIIITIWVTFSIVCALTAKHQGDLLLYAKKICPSHIKEMSLFK